MLPAETIALFVAASVALALAPGPDNLFVLTLSALHGRLAGLLVTLGLCTGLIAHTALVALGVAAVLRTSALAFTLVKTIGAAYLLTLAWQSFRAAASSRPDSVGAAPGPGKLYVRGIVMNVTNPKVAIFFLAFLPQFADPQRGSPALQIVALGGLFIVSALAVFSAIAWAAGFLGEWMKRSPRAPLVMNRIAGVVFVILAARLAWSTA
ncbi:MAG: LysE family translocator [Burkholderiales bacterium]